jgi:NTE family protein
LWRLPSGNLSLHQELHFIEKIDQLLDEGLLASNGRYKPIVVRLIELSSSLGTVSKLNRAPAFIRDLMARGAQRAEEFLTALAFEDAWQAKDVDVVLSFFADDAELVSSAPFPSTHGTSRGVEPVRAFVERHLAGNVVIDLTRKQVTQDYVARTVRTQRGVRGDVRSFTKARSRRCRSAAEAGLRPSVQAVRLIGGAHAGRGTRQNGCPPGSA